MLISIFKVKLLPFRDGSTSCQATRHFAERRCIQCTAVKVFYPQKATDLLFSMFRTLTRKQRRTGPKQNKRATACIEQRANAQNGLLTVRLRHLLTADVASVHCNCSSRRPTSCPRIRFTLLFPPRTITRGIRALQLAVQFRLRILSILATKAFKEVCTKCKTYATPSTTPLPTP